MLILTICQLGFAQMTTWTWDLYKMKFDAPADFKISKNDKTIFSAGNGKLHLTIYPKNGNISYDDMLSGLSTWANNQTLSYDSEPAYMEDLNRYWGCYIDGSASNGNPTTVMILKDPDYPEIYFYVWLQYQSVYFDTAVEIIKSFTPY